MGTTTFVETIQPHLGGNGANTSLAVAECGVPVRLLGTVGCDEAGRAAVETLCRRGVDTQFIAATNSAPTAATIVMVNAAGDRKFYHQVGASAHAFTSPVDFTPEIIDGMAHYHLASLFILPRMRAHAPECLARAKAAGLDDSLDTNWDPQGLWLKDIGPCLPHLDFIFVNEDEARMITGSSVHATAASHLLAGGARTAVMKLGPRGCAIYTGNEEIICPAFEVAVKDTTGAGDCFAGAFLSCARTQGVPGRCGHVCECNGRYHGPACRRCSRSAPVSRRRGMDADCPRSGLAQPSQPSCTLKRGP